MGSTVYGSLKALVEEIAREVISEELPLVFGRQENQSPPPSPLVGALKQTKKRLRDFPGDQSPEMVVAQEKQIDSLINKLMTRRKGRANLNKSDMETLDKLTRWMTFLPFGKAYRRGLAKYLRSKKDPYRKEDPFRDFRRYTYDTQPLFREDTTASGKVQEQEEEDEDREESKPKEIPTVEKYFHGTNIDLKPGALVLPPNKTKRMSEKGRKKNLDVVFFTKDPKSALIYAGRAVQSLGGGIPVVYQVEPMGPVSVLNDDPGTTVLSAPYAKVVGKIKFEKTKPKKV